MKRILVLVCIIIINSINILKSNTSELQTLSQRCDVLCIANILSVDRSYLIFNQNPIEAKQSPMSLFPPLDFKYNFSGISSNETQGPVIPFDKIKNTEEVK